MNESEPLIKKEIQELKSLEKTIFGTFPIVCAIILAFLDYALKLGIQFNVGAIIGATLGGLIAWITVSSIKSKRFIEFNQKAKESVQSNDYKNAIYQFELALSLKPKNPALHYNLAWLYSLVEDKEKSMLHLYNAQKFGLQNLKAKIEKNENFEFIKVLPEYEEFYNKLR